MPETHDPIRLLETFGTGGGHPAPLAPAEVRRLGDRRRARHRRMIVAATILAVVAAVAPVALLSRQHGDDPGPATRTSATPTPTRATSAPAPTEITYPGQGVTVTDAADTASLVGTSSDFRTFIAAQAAKATQDGASCPDAAHGVTVQKYSSAGYAVGGVNSCGGYEALWVRHDGTWGEGQGTQDVWDCDALAYLQVPRSFAGDCGDEAGIFGQRGSGAPEPGMTKAQAEAAGIQITSDAAAPPCVSTRYTSAAVPANDTSGLFSPHDGLVQVAMTSSMKTPEKIGLGTPRSTVLTTYANGHTAGDHLWLVPRPGGTAYLIRFGADGRVIGFVWQLEKADCGGYMM